MSKLTKVKYWFDNGESVEFSKKEKPKGGSYWGWRVKLTYKTGDIIDLVSATVSESKALRLLKEWREDKT